MKFVKDDKTFWKCIKPLFSEKSRSSKEKTILVDDDVIISQENEVAEKLNELFITAVEKLQIERFSHENEVNKDSNYITVILNKYSQHPSILKIKEYVNIDNSFHLAPMTAEDMNMEISKLKTNNELLHMI